MEFSVAFWAGFIIFVISALAIDLGVFNPRGSAPSLKRSLGMTILWISCSMFFCFLIFKYYGTQPALEFLTGYIVELSLSVDNVFVFIMIFSYFKIPINLQHRVLFWGIVGAVVMRFIMITGGVYLIHKFEWIFFFFGLFLIYTGYKIAITNHDEQDVSSEDKGITKFLRRFFPIVKEFHGDRFFVKVNGKTAATPLFVVLLLVEKTDLIFALDSIPAILAITQNIFIVFTSNVFAILGLRSMYFLLANILDKFRYLKYGIAVLLMFIGVKMVALITLGYKVKTIYSLSFIIVTLTTSILLSIFIKSPRKQ